MAYWNPITPINVPHSITIGGAPPPDALTRIAAALERVAFQLEQYNAKHSITVTTTPAPKPVIRKSKVRRRG